MINVLLLVGIFGDRRPQLYKEKTAREDRQTQ